MSGDTLGLLLTVIGIAAYIVVNTLVLVFVPRGRRPQTALAWLLAIYFVPVIGIVLFVIAGSHRLPRARRLKQTEVSRIIRESTEGDDRVLKDATWPSWLESITRLNRALGSMPLVGGNSATLYADDAEALTAMIEAVRAARSTVHAEFYILSLDATSEPFFAALEEAHARGVTVRVLLDHLGSRRYPGYRGAIRRLTAAGVQWYLMLPFQPLRGKLQRPDLRNHRKILVVDGQVGFTGSQNVIEEAYQHRRGLRWKDFMARFEGPVVAGIDALFITDWYCETDELLGAEVAVPPERAPGDLACQVVPSGPGFEGENNLRMLNSLVYAAQRRVVISSPYLVPDDSMLYALTTAAQRGVDVELFVSEIGDQFWASHAQHSYYEDLLRAGVRVQLYEPPVILHAKHLTVDGEVAVIGSSNLDMRSFTLDLEISVLVRGRSFLDELARIEDAYRARCRELSLDEWILRPRGHQAWDAIARLTAAVQ